MSLFKRHNGTAEGDNGTITQHDNMNNNNNHNIEITSSGSDLPRHRPHNEKKDSFLKGEIKDHRRCHPFRALKIAMRSSSRLSGWANFLIPFIPIGIVFHYKLPGYHSAVFATNFLAMIPAANMLSFAAQEIALKIPKTFGATFETLMGAVVELIVCMILIFGEKDKPKIAVVQAALIGSMLANLLLVTGVCFIAGGILYQHQELAEHVTEVTGAGLLVASVGLIIPSQWAQAAKLVNTNGLELSQRVLDVSRLVSIGLLISYAALLLFQLKTHHSHFDAALEAAEARDRDAEEDEARDKLSLLEGILLLLVALTFVSFAAYFLIEEIDPIIEKGRISDAFLGLILIPVVEKAAEHLTAIDDAWDGQMDVALQHCLGATIQTALLVAPLTVLVSWGRHVPMDLNFAYVWAFLLVVSVLVVGNFVRDGKSNWLEGGYLLMVYYAIAIAAWYYPNSESEKGTSSQESHGTTEGSSEGSSTTALAEAATTAAAAATVEAVKRLLFT